MKLEPMFSTTTCRVRVCRTYDYHTAYARMYYKGAFGAAHMVTPMRLGNWFVGGMLAMWDAMDLAERLGWEIVGVDNCGSGANWSSR